MNKAVYQFWKQFKWPVMIILGVGVLYFFIRDERVSLGPGVMAPGIPEQINIKGSKSFEHKGYQITPLAYFSMEAKLLNKKRYYSGKESEISPVDFAVGWKRMSDESVLKHIKIKQSGRWVYWQAQQLPIPQREIERSIANVHLVPSTDSIKRQLLKAPEGAIIALEGKLIKVNDNKGWRWVSSMTRHDTGNRSCEIVWVEEFKVVKETR